MYMVNSYSEIEDSALTSYIFNNLEEARLNGWGWAIEAFEKSKEGVHIFVDSDVMYDKSTFTTDY